MLHGRSRECVRIDGLLDAARSGSSGALVLRGEPGIGKTALLEYARLRADGFSVLRGAGIESESEFPFAAVHQLLRPVWNHAAVLPARQRTALDAAFGLRPSSGDDRFLVSLGILGMLADAADEQPVLCLIDDAQWLDEPSVDALTFVARRLEADGIVMMFAVRDDEMDVLASAGLPEVRLHGVDTAAAHALLAEGPPVSPSVRDVLVETTAGNPLGLRELPASLSADQLSGRAALPDRMPLGDGLERVFLTRVRRLPDATQTVLLLAAAEQTGDLRVVLAAAEFLDISVDSLGEAEAAGIVRIADDRVTFRQPMVRSAVYRGATFLQRRAANQAIAAALTRPEDVDQRTWQLAAAAVGPDEGLAAQLVAIADRATARGGHASAATALERAAELTSASETQARRLLSAAQCAWQAGKPDRAATALERAAPLATEVKLRAGISRLRGKIAFACGEPDTAYENLRSAADLISALDPPSAASALAEMGQIAWVSGDARRLGEAARRLVALPTPTDQSAVTASLVVGLDLFLKGDTAAATAALQRAAESIETSDDAAILSQTAGAALFLGDDARALPMFIRAVAAARLAGAVDMLPALLGPLGALQAWTGRHASAMATATEGLRLALDMGQENAAAHHRSVLAWVAAAQGREQDCRDAAAATLSWAIGHRLGPHAGIASWALALLDLGMGRPAEAFDRLNAMAGARTGEGHQVVKTFAAADYVEAAMRVGQPDRAEQAALTLRAWAAHVQAPWALALAARCDALLADGSEEHFARAAALHAEGSRPFDAARTELLRGEFLRRRRSRARARTHLRAACEVFEGLGAAPWTERARGELRATGETARTRDPSTVTRLTPQELQIARLVGAGGTNREIAAELFLSPRTIDYHLHKIFTKLGISSRAQLVRLDVES
ncbi:helix-turn-helix transcriptional regulator [Mycolicibacterium sp.]|uniref:AAA family ATPase n=1 Tax=Mycolicibacterium sp. TaxID=2320850 RepID=UPI001A30FE59|nr:helix-turn-helix transcriptional regulator [Mycolicibacterium sp.]MBJ7340217.1 AAA family ATPase [Mycolicibacterium sp.]